MFSTGENEILNPLEILRIPQDFDFRKGPANTKALLSPNINDTNISSNR